MTKTSKPTNLIDTSSAVLRVRRSNSLQGFRRTAVALAVGLCISSGIVHAQAVSGSIFGNAGVEGGTVVIENLDTGVKYTTKPNSSGRYSATTLPSGRYKVTLERNGASVAERSNVQVLVGQGVEVPLSGDEGLQTLDEALVVASVNRIDVSTVESKVVVTREQLEKLPILPNLTAIAMVAPGVVQADSRYGNIPSFSGSSASENAYYIDGFPVLRSLTQFGYTELPYNAVDQVQVSTGGYGVEYGRATGGVVSVNTRSGTNEWDFGAKVQLRPEGLWAGDHNIYHGDNERTGNAWANEGQIYQYRRDNKSERQTFGAYVSGPIIPNKLFVFAAGEYIKLDGGGTVAFATTAGAVNTARLNGWTDYVYKTPRWSGKVDWYITENHHLSVTGFQDRTKEKDERSGFDYVTLERVGDVVSGYDRDRNTRTYVGNYVGQLTPDLTVSAMAGQLKTTYSGGPTGYRADCPTITRDPGAEIPGLTYPTCQLSTSAGFLEGRFDKTQAGRLDIEYRLGSHKLKVGYDYNKATTLVGATDYSLNFPGTLVGGFAGGYQWLYQHFDNPNLAVYPDGGVRSPASGGGNGLQGYFVERVVSANLGTPHVVQQAQYIKDIWRVADDVTLELGLRNEQFANYGSTGPAFIKKNTQIAPRLGAIWDVEGNSSTKVFASLGRYHLAVPNNVARRGVDGATNTNEAFVYSGVDQETGAPTGLVSLGPVYSANNEFGQSRDPNTLTPIGVKSHFQDTLAFGVEKNLGFAYGGAKFTFSNLGSAIDDFCDARQFLAWADAHGYDAGVDEDGNYNDPNIGNVAENQFHACVLINPGRANSYKADLDGDGDYEVVDFTKEELGFPKLKRRYSALDFFLEHTFDGRWYARLDYTLSWSKGNLEGQLNSDIGQRDPSVTLAGDYPELAVNSSGYLPNDRRHQIKLNGYYQLTPEVQVGGVFGFASGRPKNCRGWDEDLAAGTPDYGSYLFYCDGEVVERGTFGRLPSSIRLDLSARYQPKWAQGVTVGLNVYNVANKQTVDAIEERLNNGSSSNINPNWDRPISYTSARFVELMATYSFGQ